MAPTFERHVSIKTISWRHFEHLIEAAGSGGIVQTPPPEYDSHEVRRGYVEVGANSNNLPARSGLAHVC